MRLITAAIFAALTSQASAITCNDIPEVQFEQFWENLNGRHHVALNDDGVVQFSVKGGIGSGINIMLVNGGTLPTQITESFTDAYDMYIGGNDEPVIHASESIGTAPLADNIVDISADPFIVESEFTDMWLKVVSQTLTVGKGIWVNGASAVFTAEFTGGDKSIDEAIFSYGYGDLECVDPPPEYNIVFVETGYKGKTMPDWNVAGYKFQADYSVTNLQECAEWVINDAQCDVTKCWSYEPLSNGADCLSGVIWHTGATISTSCTHGVGRCQCTKLDGPSGCRTYDHVANYGRAVYRFD